MRRRRRSLAARMSMRVVARVVVMVTMTVGPLKLRLQLTLCHQATGR